MADENVAQTDVNSQNGVAASSSASAPETVVTPPTGEIPATKENRVPQSRFNEVVQEKNRERELREMYEARIRELETRPSVQPQQESVLEAQVKRLVKNLDMDEKAARELLSAQDAIAQSQRQQLEARQSQFQAEEWARNKAQNDSDWKDIEPELDKEFSRKTPQMQHAIASNREMLEMFYDSVKSKHLTGKAKEAYSRGSQAAYEAKQVKQAVSSTPGTSSGSQSTALTREAINKMTPEEYRKRQPEINEAIRNRTLK